MKTEGRKILVVDDNAEFVEKVRGLLNIEGFQTLIAHDGEKALEKILSESPELVLLDLKLPNISGEEILKRIREIDKEIAVIIITGNGGEQLAVELMKAGAMDFFSKSIERESLLKAVRDALQIRDAQIDDRQRKIHYSLEKFFPFLAHEIRNPLHAIGGALAIIQRRSNLKDEYLAKAIKIIQEEVEHLNEFVQDCLDLVRPPVVSHILKVDVNEVISAVMNTISHMFEELSQKIRIVNELNPQLPRIYANYEEIKQAFLNIVKNSFEAMNEEGELTIKTGFKSDPFPGVVEITFKDNGPGIRKEDMKNLFRPFFTTKLRGTGLGLVLCYRIIVERHHGKIYVESEEGKGTKIAVELPMGEPMYDS